MEGAAPECIYGVQKDKTVVWAGSVFNSEIQTWNEIIKLACGNYHLVGLKKNGSVCIAGNMLDSEELAAKIEKWGVSGISQIVFVIGGSLGLGQTVLNRADYKLSFSRMTFPHQLMQMILLEQIYRSYRIMNHEPYHK